MKIAEVDNLITTYDIAKAFDMDESNIRKTYVYKKRSQRLKILAMGTLCHINGISSLELKSAIDHINVVKTGELPKEEPKKRKR